MPILDLAGGIAQGVASAWSARQQMRFQERMRNTEVQARAADLEKAGFNRLLAVGEGASSPQGAGFEIPDVAASASARASERKARELTQAEIDGRVAATGLTAAQMAKVQAETAEIQAGRWGSRFIGPDAWGSLTGKLNAQLEKLQGMRLLSQPSGVAVKRELEKVKALTPKQRAERMREIERSGKAKR